jgi:hypothetical protein
LLSLLSGILVPGFFEIAVGTGKDNICFVRGSAFAERYPVVKVKGLPLTVIGSPVVVRAALSVVSNPAHRTPTVDAGLVPL